MAKVAKTCNAKNKWTYVPFKDVLECIKKPDLEDKTKLVMPNLVPNMEDDVDSIVKQFFA